MNLPVIRRPGLHWTRHWLLVALLCGAGSPARAAAPELEFTKGVVAFGQGRLPEAEAAFRAVLADQPDNRQALYYLGQVLFSSGRFDEAATTFSRVLQFEPGRGQVRLDLALSLVKLGRFAEAERTLAAAGGEVTGRASFNYYLGYCRYKQGRLAEAVEPLERASRLDQGFAAAATYYLGLVQAGLGRREQAQRLFALAATADDRRLASFASHNLHLLEGGRGRRSNRNWWLMAAAGGGWDSNVTLEVQEPGRGAAGVVFLAAGGGYRPRLAKMSRLDLGLRLFRSFHTSSTTRGYDLTDTRVTASWHQGLGGGHRLTLGYDFELQLLDGAAALGMEGFGLYLHAHSARAAVRFQEGDSSGTGIAYRFRASLFHSGLEVRDYFQHQGLLGQDLTLLGGRWRLLLQAGLVWEDARHIVFDNWGPLVNLYSSYQALEWLRVELLAGWQRADYHRTKRVDNRLSAGLATAFALGKHLELVLAGNYLENFSSADYSYRRLMISATLAGKM